MRKAPMSTFPAEMVRFGSICGDGMVSMVNCHARR